MASSFAVDLRQELFSEPSKTGVFVGAYRDVLAAFLKTVPGADRPIRSKTSETEA
jgi:hypothetical protein